MEENQNACINCEYLVSAKLNICNAFHPPITDIYTPNTCADFSKKDERVEFEKNQALRTKVRQESIKTNFRLGEMLSLQEAYIAQCHKLGFLNHQQVSRSTPYKASNEIKERVKISEKLIIKNILRQKEEIVYRFGIEPEYVLLDKDIRRSVEVFLYERYGYFGNLPMRINQVIETVLGLIPLSDPNLPPDYVQVIIPILRMH